MGGFDIRGFFSRWGWFLLLAAAAFMAAYFFIGRKGKTASAQVPNGSTLLGNNASGQPVVEYVPTTGDSYTNINYQMNRDSGNIANTTSTVNNTTIPPSPPAVPPPHRPPVVPPIGPPIVSPPPSQPPEHRPPPTPVPTTPPQAPPTEQYTVRHGDTLTSIAQRYGTTWQHLYMMNKATVDSWSAKYKNPIAGGPWNNIFPNEPLIVPKR